MAVINNNLKEDWASRDVISASDINDISHAVNELSNSNFVSDSAYTHTDNNYTTQDKEKLTGIESGAQENVIEEIKVNGTTVVPVNKVVNITSSSGDYYAGDGLELSGDTFSVKLDNSGNVSLSKSANGLRADFSTSSQSVIVIDDSVTGVTVQPNVLYIFTNRTSDLDITLGAETPNVLNEYHMIIETGLTAPLITFPNTIDWNGIPLSVGIQTTVEISILNNSALWM